jgi:hypothetical protein
MGANSPTCQKYTICKTTDLTKPRQGIRRSTCEGNLFIISDENEELNE